MTDETQDAPDAPETEDAAGPSMAELLIPMMLGAGGKPLRTADGVGPLLSSTAAFVEMNLKPDLVTVTEPETGVEVLAYVDRAGVHALPDDFFDEARDAPRFRRGTATMTSLDSFIAHIKRFGDEDTAVFANDNRIHPSLTAVLDYHRADVTHSAASATDGVGGGVAAIQSQREQGDFRHGRHRTEFAFPMSDEWLAWKQSNAKTMTMEEFARFMEDRVLDVAEIGAVPKSAERFVEMNGGPRNIADWALLTKLAKGLTIYENAIVTNATNLASGVLQLTIWESQEAEVEGIKIDVPTMFFIEIPLFREGVLYRIPVRLRHKKGRGSITFSYELWGHERAFKDAFGEAIDKVQAETSAPVFYGSPEA